MATSNENCLKVFILSSQIILSIQPKKITSSNTKGNKFKLKIGLMVLSFNVYCTILNDNNT